MTSKAHQTYLTRAQLQVELAPLNSKIERLWDEVFPKYPPGPGGLGERLQEVSRRLAAVDQRITREAASLQEQLDEVIKTVAELKEIVEELKNRGQRVMTAGR